MCKPNSEPNNIYTGIHAYTHTCMHTSKLICQHISRNLRMTRNPYETV